MSENYYLFEFGAMLDRYFYTSAQIDIKKGDKIYKSETIFLNELGKDSLNDDASISCGFDCEPINLYKDFNPSTNINVKVMDAEEKLLFYGRIASVEFDAKDGSAAIKLSTLGALMKGKIPTRTFSRECGFELFDGNCALNKKDYSLTLLGKDCEFLENFTQIKSAKIGEKPDGYFLGGYVSFNNQHSYIMQHTGDTIFLMFPLKKLNKNVVLYVYAGCDKLLNTCKNKFNNEINYGGFPFVPGKNPVTQGY
ncbi:phage BR0599 family protein [Campylobacter hominis]|uniref:Bacteriophage phiJL001 Gp84 C-terminal domain-containing protein n=1 Tax=Campylobacter hominis (strain ATCC BAA-381 / DSM 21671 / CCUG 45161 / LMG 19568 / NCTC 13146 / CH001A) TaxID=360107 RepID=A7I048_CAMHC|nr:phage BR0599 family protein [Campylobacter hominis]ABS51263.1 conserved hypothetical protein [Campylobacter hominis ATCC BAA-381]UAK85258.1 phage BR0599 family protein [Campylobacter hominis]SUW84445.1 Uncharacterized conserved protein [Campylobacter hominis]